MLDINNQHKFILKTFDQSLATPEAHGSSNKQQIKELYPTQKLGDNDFGSTQRKGKEKAKRQTNIGGPQTTSNL